MPTNEERRGVANNLRGGFDVTKEGLYYHLNGTLFGMGVYASSEQRLRDGLLNLADIIEPEPERTCRLVCVDREIDQNGVMHLFHRCSECGHDLPYEAELGHCNFCPNCGAKVVHDAD